MSTLPSLGRRGEGWVVLQLTAFGAVLVAGRFLDGPRTGAIHDIGLIAGLLVMFAGAALATIAVLELRRGDAFTPVPRPRPEGSLVESGPYRWIRHPIYAATLVGALGWAIARLSWPALVATLVLAVVLDLKRRREEEWLEGRYDGYAAYRRRTKAFIPGIY